MIKNILESLSDEQLSQLMYAFEGETTQYIVLDGDTYIGVNTKLLVNLLPLYTAGVWAYGRIKQC